MGHNGSNKELPKQYSDLIQKFPDILKAKFKTETDSAIFHQIDTCDANPHKCKVRPILASSEKSQEGKKIWKEMEKVGVIERVKVSHLTQWTNPLHLVCKPNNRGWPVCGDFRL